MDKKTKMDIDDLFEIVNRTFKGTGSKKKLEVEAEIKDAIIEELETEHSDDQAKWYSEGRVNGLKTALDLL